MADNQTTAYSVQLLSGNRRYSTSENYLRQETNKVYTLEKSIFNEAIKAYRDSGSTEQIARIASIFITHHVSYVQPRILKLFRYYQGDNDIHYIPNDKPENRADNRIASGFPKFITNIRVGHTVGNPVKYKTNVDSTDKDDKVMDQLADIIAAFNKQNDIDYHEKVMSKNLSVCGRAYELEYIKEKTVDVKIRALKPDETFIVYDTTIEAHSLFGVRHYTTEFDGEIKYWAEVYTDDFIFYFSGDGFYNSRLTYDDVEENKLPEMPITEFINNDERMGDWEAKMDDIDAVDKAKSSMANFQEDFENATLHIDGDIRTSKENEKKGITGMLSQMVSDLKKRVMFTKPSIISKGMSAPIVVPSKVEYITKQFDSQGWKVYLDGLINDIHKDTNTPNLTDENFSGDQSGQALSYKLWGSDQERAIHEALYTRGIMRRLRLLAGYKEPLDGKGLAGAIENVEIIFTPNLPRNDQEIVDRAKALHDTGDISSETFHELIQAVTGITPDTEAQRMKDERESEPDDQDADIPDDLSILRAARQKLGIVSPDKAAADDSKENELPGQLSQEKGKAPKTQNKGQ
ncbi:phage portal protein [Enterococcus faecium]